MDERRTGGEPSGSPELGRRRFLSGAAATAAALAVGCSSESARSGDVARQRSGSATTTTLHSAKLARDPFTLGVASGDPLSDRVVLWTRLAPVPLPSSPGGSGVSGPVDVVWEVSADARFTKVVTSGVATATDAHAHSVHVDATGLEPGTDHHYRFRVGRWTSPVGRTRTLAEGSPKRFRLAVVNCQMYEAGTYAAYRHLADEDVDLVTHLGDYIYEYPAGVLAFTPERRSAPADGPVDLDSYRLRYASYKLDPNLLAVHARHPFACTWDDHEVANNYMGDTVPGGADPAVLRARRQAAYQAWWEHLPVRLDPPDDGALAVYRGFDVGDLARFSLLDERQDAVVPPCRDTSTSGLDYGDCTARTSEDRTRLGDDQESWIGEQLSSSKATWNLVGNPVVLAGVNAATGDQPDAYYLDTWDGFPQARERFIGQLAKADNPVVLTGDYHAGMVLDIHRKPFDESSDLVAPELMSPPISSTLFPADVSARTPQLRQQINAHGYLTVEATPDRLTARFRTLGDVTDARSAIKTAATWLVDAGDPVAQKT